MPKKMQKIVLFIEPNEAAYFTHSKVGHLFMNRFAVDEHAGFEILKGLELGKLSWKMSIDKSNDNFENEKQQKGIDLWTMDHGSCLIFFIVNSVK